MECYDTLKTGKSVALWPYSRPSVHNSSYIKRFWMLVELLCWSWLIATFPAFYTTGQVQTLSNKNSKLKMSCVLSISINYLVEIIHRVFFYCFELINLTLRSCFRSDFLYIFHFSFRVRNSQILHGVLWYYVATVPTAE